MELLCREAAAFAAVDVVAFIVCVVGVDGDGVIAVPGKSAFGCLYPRVFQLVAVSLAAKAVGGDANCEVEMLSSL